MQILGAWHWWLEGLGCLPAMPASHMGPSLSPSCSISITGPSKRPERSSERWPSVGNPGTHMEVPEETPGSWLQTAPTLATVPI